MTIFELVKIALDELYREGATQYGGLLDGAIKDRMAYLQTSYGKLNVSAREPVDYKDPATRFAYVYKYTAAHGTWRLQLGMYLQKFGQMPKIQSQITYRVLKKP